MELLHAEDKAVLKELNVHSTEDLHKLRQVSPMVLRMKTNMSPTIRSQAKIQYKVQSTCIVHAHRDHFRYLSVVELAGVFGKSVTSVIFHFIRTSVGKIHLKEILLVNKASLSLLTILYLIKLGSIVMTA